MIQINKPAAWAMAFGSLMVSTAFADGVDKMYDYREGYIDEIEIVGDATFPNGETFAVFEMFDMQMRFYVPQDAVYVMMTADNPVISQQIPFEGGWVSTAAPGQERWSNCPGAPISDHNGQMRGVYGDLVWTNTRLENNDLYFSLQIGHCDDPVEDWAFNNPSKNASPIEEAKEICGNESDLYLRALGCSDIIANPDATPQDVSWAHWSRAYVRCGDAPQSDIVADLMSAVRLDPLEWQDYYQRVSGYRGPMDGQMNYQLHGAVTRFAGKGCR